MKIVCLDKNSDQRTWFSDAVDEIDFAARDGTDIFRITLEDVSVTLRANDTPTEKTYAFLSRIGRGLELFPGETLELRTGDCFGHAIPGGRTTWYLVWSEPKDLRRMPATGEKLLEKRTTRVFF
jgi:hypothetical protein